MSEPKKIKPALPKGTRDFLPTEVAKRNYIFNIIKSVFHKYGFQQIETPAFERLETLTGKYGEEGDRLLFKILNSGDYLKEVPEDLLTKRNSAGTTKHLSEKGLRYDLTVPLARYVVQHQDSISFPFKRYHIAPVWRADRPQKGRYQEFYQCDADVIGSKSLINEVELTEIFIEVFQKLGISVTVRINNRKLIEAMCILAMATEKITEVTTAIDKLDKVGIDGVRTELHSIGLDDLHTDLIISLFTNKSEGFRSKIEHEPIGKEGIKELDFVIGLLKNKENVAFDATLARGLNYYTGIIWEVVANDVKIGSIASGGRYDNLTELFGGINMSGVGISFGIERIFDAMEELNLFPTSIVSAVKILFVPREESLESFAFLQAQALRKEGIPAEVFLGNVKKQKQFNYAEEKGIAYLSEIGKDERESGIFRVKNQQTREEERLTLVQLIDKLR